MIKLRKTIAVNVIVVLLFVLSFNVTSFASMPESEPNDSSSTATVIPSDYDLTQEITASIGSAGDVDFYRFTPINSGGYSIVTLGTTDTFGYLYDSSMNLLDTSDDQLYPSGTNFELRYTLTANSVYYIKVKHTTTTGTGNYSLKITPINYSNDEVEPNGSFTTAVSRLWGDYNTPATASIGTPGDEDYYRFAFPAGGTYTFETFGSSDTYGQLYDSNFNEIAADDDSGSEYPNMKITYNLIGYQTYYIKVRLWSPNSTGSYSLKVTPLDGPYGPDSNYNDFASAREMEKDMGYFGEAINYANDADYYKFTPDADGIYTFQSYGTYNVDAELYGPGQPPVYIKSDTDSGSGNNFMLDARLDANNTYYLKVTAPGGATGSFSLDVVKGKCLPVPQYLQLPYDNLCWATSAAMIESYFCNDTTNRTLNFATNRAQTAYSSMSTQYGANYYNYPSVFNQPEMLTTADNYIDSAPNHYVRENLGGYDPDSPNPYVRLDPLTTYEYSLNELYKSIDNGYPILVKIPNTAGGAHVIVVKGYKETSSGVDVIYNDPLDGQEHMGSLESYSGEAYATYYPNGDIEPNNAVEDNCRMTSITVNTGSTSQDQGTIWRSGDTDCYLAPKTPGYIPVQVSTTGSTDVRGEVYEYDYNNHTWSLIVSSTNQSGNFTISYNSKGYTKYCIKVIPIGNATGSYTLCVTQ